MRTKPNSIRQSFARQTFWHASFVKFRQIFPPSKFYAIRYCMLTLNQAFPVQPTAYAKSSLNFQCNLLLTPKWAFQLLLTPKQPFPVLPTSNPKKAIECRSCSYGKLSPAAGVLDTIYINEKVRNRWRGDDELNGYTYYVTLMAMLDCIII